MEYPELKRTVLAHAREWTPRNVLIEDRASGTQLIQELRQEGLSTLTRCDSKEEKIVRMSTASNMIENGQVYLPENAPWLSQYVHELVTFPNGKHYDLADSTSQALIWFKSRAFLSGIQQYYRRSSDPKLQARTHQERRRAGAPLEASRRTATAAEGGHTTYGSERGTTVANGYGTRNSLGRSANRSIIAIATISSVR